MSEPTSTNKTANTVNEAVDMVKVGVISAVEALILADVPALGLPIIKQLWQALLAWIANYFEKAAQTGIAFAVIDSQISSEESALTKTLQDLITAEKTGNPDAIKQAIQAYADANSALIHSDGSATIK